MRQSNPFMSHLAYLASSAMLLAVAAPAAAQAPYRNGDCGTFTVAVIPDSQNYTDYRHQKWSGFAFDAIDQFNDQMRYIRTNARSNGGDIVFASHVGDVWQHYSKWMDEGHAERGFDWVPNAGSSVAISPKIYTRLFEIPAAAQAFELINGHLPFSVVPGNHDYDALWTDPNDPPRSEDNYVGTRHIGGLTGYLSAFSSDSSLFKGKEWYVGAHENGADSAQIFTAGECRFLHIGLQYHAPDSALEWAAEVISRYPGIPTIVTTHDYLHRDGVRNVRSNPNNARIDPIDNDPEMIFNDFISQHDQIFMVLSGHVSGQAYSVAQNRHGGKVHQVMADYQSRRQTAIDAGDSRTRTGDGWMRLMQFNLDGQQPQVHVRTYSTHYNAFSTDLPQYAAWYKKADGQTAVSDEEFLERDDFVIKLDDFTRRFDR